MEETQIAVEVNAQDEDEEFIRKLIKKGTLALKPSLVRQGIRYVEAEETWKVDLDKARIIIDMLTEKGFFTPEIVDRVLTCPKCGSPEAHSKYACPKCKSYNVGFTELIEHIKCGNIGSKDQFTKGSSLVCPRCQIELAEKASDYRVIGNFYQCDKCAHRFDKPDAIHMCQNCGTTFTYQNAKYIKLFAYSITEEARKSFKTELPILEDAKRILVGEGFKVRFQAKVKGASGAQSPFDVLAQKGTIYLVIDVSTAGNKNDIIALLAKKVDVNPSEAAIINMSTSDEIANLGKVFGITVFKATDNQNVPEDFITFLRSLPLEESSVRPTKAGGG